VVRQTVQPAHVALWLKGGSVISAVAAPVTISERTRGKQEALWQPS